MNECTSRGTNFSIFKLLPFSRDGFVKERDRFTKSTFSFGVEPLLELLPPPIGVCENDSLMHVSLPVHRNASSKEGCRIKGTVPRISNK